LGAGDVEPVDLVVCLWCFDVWAGVVDLAAPEDVEVECVEDEDVDGAAVGFGAGAVDCAAATIGRPSAIARLTNFFISISPCSRCRVASGFRRQRTRGSMNAA
jgi:hypothetical protein